MDTCDVCGFVHKNYPMAIIQEGPDSVLRCKVCRHRLMFGEYINSDAEVERRIQAGEFTDRYKNILRGLIDEKVE